MAAGHVIHAALAVLLLFSVSCSRSTLWLLLCDLSPSTDTGYALNQTLLCCNATVFGTVTSVTYVPVAVHNRPPFTAWLWVTDLDLSQLFIHRPILSVVCLHVTTAAAPSEWSTSHWSLPISGRLANVYTNLLVDLALRICHIDLKLMSTEAPFYSPFCCYSAESNLSQVLRGIRPTRLISTSVF